MRQEIVADEEAQEHKVVHNPFKVVPKWYSPGKRKFPEFVFQIFAEYPQLTGWITWHAVRASKREGISTVWWLAEASPRSARRNLPISWKRGNACIPIIAVLQVVSKWTLTLTGVQTASFWILILILDWIHLKTK